VFEEEIRHTEDLEFIWMSSRRVAFGGKSSSSDRYPHAQQAARKLLMMINY
jgi:hypothetical protein